MKVQKENQNNICLYHIFSFMYSFLQSSIIQAETAFVFPHLFYFLFHFPPYGNWFNALRAHFLGNTFIAEMDACM